MGFETLRLEHPRLAPAHTLHLWNKAFIHPPTLIRTNKQKNVTPVLQLTLCFQNQKAAFVAKQDSKSGDSLTEE